MAIDAKNCKAYIVGSGIGGLSAAAFLIRDAGVSGKNITVFEQLPGVGGSMDGEKSPVVEGAFVTRGGRMVERESFVSLWNLMSSIPCPERPGMSLMDDFNEFNTKEHGQLHNSKARLIGENMEIIDAMNYELDTRAKLEIIRLCATPECVVGARRITDYFGESFLKSNFWDVWRTFFAFQPWHSAIEMRRYLLRFSHCMGHMATQRCILRTRYNQYDSITRPIGEWLKNVQGVKFVHDVIVEDAVFSPYDKNDSKAERYVTALQIRRSGSDMAGLKMPDPNAPTEVIKIGKNDVCFMSIGSMTSDSTMGNEKTVPKMILDKKDGGWRLWQNIALKASDFGRPNTFCGNIEESVWESFTLTMKGYTLLGIIQDRSGNEPGTGVLTTLKKSNWFMTFTVPNPPHFIGQPEGVFTLWAYALEGYKQGKYVKKTMFECTGEEILTEFLGQLGLLGHPAEKKIREETSITTVMMPYITSQFMRRDIADRPLVVPHNSKNFGFLGQFTEIGGADRDVVFTVEFSVRGAMKAVYQLFNIKKARPGIYDVSTHPVAAWRSLRCLVTGWGEPCYD